MFNIEYISHHDEEYPYDMYKLNNTTIAVVMENYSLGLNRKVDPSKTVLRISFSTIRGWSIPQDEIDYTLKYFGFDASKKFFVLEKPISFNPNGNVSDVLYYEKILDVPLNPKFRRKERVLH